ncbi:hypothetical protein TNCV_2392781 [Trichonephila clavipes]|nr:hypothetical protein TNCV_2392781 [Trichonephila clavipes]
MFSPPTRPIRSGVPQNSLLGWILVNLYESDIPQIPSLDLAMYAENTAVIKQYNRFSVVISNLQRGVLLTALSLAHWKLSQHISLSCFLFTRRWQLPGGLSSVKNFCQPFQWLFDGFWRRTRNFEPCSSEEDDTSADTPSSNFHTTPTSRDVLRLVLLALEPYRIVGFTYDP